MRGDGTLILRGGIWYYRWYADGRPVEESLRTSDAQTAERRRLRLRRKRERGEHLDSTERRVTVAELLDDLETHLEVVGASGRDKSRSHLKAVRAELGHLKASALETATIERAHASWLREGRAPATICRRLELLRQAYRLAARRTPPKVSRVPHVPLPRVSNARQGFLSREEIDRLLRAVRRRPAGLSRLGVVDRDEAR